MKTNYSASGTGSGPYGNEPGFGPKDSQPAYTPNDMGLGSDLPIGLSSLLMEDPLAKQRFYAMTREEQSLVLKYVESGVNSEDAQHRMWHTVKCLREGVPGFYRNG